MSGHLSLPFVTMYHLWPLALALWPKVFGMYGNYYCHDVLPQWPLVFASMAMIICHVWPLLFHLLLPYMAIYYCQYGPFIIAISSLPFMAISIGIMAISIWHLWQLLLP